MELEIGVHVTQVENNYSFATTETDALFLLLAYLPGFRKDEIAVSLNQAGTEVTINGDKSDIFFISAEISQRVRIFHQDSIQGFSETFKIPSFVDLDKIDVGFEEVEGILVISMPKLVREEQEIALEIEKEEEVLLLDIQEREINNDEEEIIKPEPELKETEVENPENENQERENQESENREREIEIDKKPEEKKEEWIEIIKNSEEEEIKNEKGEKEVEINTKPEELEPETKKPPKFEMEKIYEKKEIEKIEDPDPDSPKSNKENEKSEEKEIIEENKKPEETIYEEKNKEKVEDPSTNSPKSNNENEKREEKEIIEENKNPEETIYEEKNKEKTEDPSTNSPKLINKNEFNNENELSDKESEDSSINGDGETREERRMRRRNKRGARSSFYPSLIAGSVFLLSLMVLFMHASKNKKRSNVR